MSDAKEGREPCPGECGMNVEWRIISIHADGKFWVGLGHSFSEAAGDRKEYQHKLRDNKWVHCPGKPSAAASEPLTEEEAHIKLQAGFITEQIYTTICDLHSTIRALQADYKTAEWAIGVLKESKRVAIEETQMVKERAEAAEANLAMAEETHKLAVDAQDALETQLAEVMEKYGAAIRYIETHEGTEFVAADMQKFLASLPDTKGKVVECDVCEREYTENDGGICQECFTAHGGKKQFDRLKVENERLHERDESQSLRCTEAVNNAVHYAKETTRLTAERDALRNEQKLFRGLVAEIVQNWRRAADEWWEGWFETAKAALADSKEGEG